MDTSNKLSSDFESVFCSWSYSPDVCLLHLASLHATSFWNPTFGEEPWILQDYLEYNHIFTQLEMLLKERARCMLGINVGATDWKESLSIQDSIIQELVESLSAPNDPLKEQRLQKMWKDMENFVNKGIAAKMKSKPAFNIEIKETNTPSTENIDMNSQKQKPKSMKDPYANKQNASHSSTIELSILNPVKELPQYWRNSQEKLANLEKKLNGFLKSSVFKFLRQVNKDKNKLIIRFPTSQNLLGKCYQNYNNFSSVRIHQAFRMLISGLINYKYKRKRKMSEDAKTNAFINIFDSLRIDENNADEKEKANRRLSMINQIDMALKYNNVLKVKQLMDDDDFKLLTEEDKKSINLKARLAMLEVYEIKQAMEKEKINKLKLSWEKQNKGEGKAAEEGEDARKSK
jgi:hypothetical protein